jgi:plastocyanin
MKAFLALLVALVILGGGYYWYTSQQAPAMNIDVSMDDMDGMDMPTPPTTPTPSPSTSTATSTPATGTPKGAVKEFTVTGKNFSFAPATMAVKQGDRVRITFVNDSGTHDLRVDGYNVGTKVIQGGASETFEFVADKTGSFEYYCSVGQHRQMGMKGTLTVTN